LLRDIRPDLKRVAVLASPDHAGERFERQSSEEMAQRLGIRIDYYPVHNKTEVETSLAALATGSPEAILAFTDPITVGNRDRIVEVAMAQRIPVISGWALFAESGALCTYGPKLSTYGPKLTASYQRAAYYVDRILEGAKPAELPIERPTVLELVVNLKTADTLGLKIPQTVLALANDVIE
jgi:putative ABC transport system substrate-binding protein